MRDTSAFAVSSVNVNGIRAAFRNGMARWLEEEAPDVLLLQEVRAEAEITSALLGEEWETHVYPSHIKGRAGVAVAVRRDSLTVALDTTSVPVHGLAEEEDPVDSGRWLEVDLVTSTGQRIRVISAYFHAGRAGDPKQEAKMRHLARIDQRMRTLYGLAETESIQTLLGGDFNVVRSEYDIKNWRPNHNKTSGVLDEEIAYLNRWVDLGWNDIVRSLTGEEHGPYSWWSRRGRAFDNNVGWRIDYHYLTPGLVEGASRIRVFRAPTWDTRFSDHAPVTLTYRV